MRRNAWRTFSSLNGFWSTRIVKGFQPIMPTFKGTLKDDDIAAIIAYLKTLK